MITHRYVGAQRFSWRRAFSWGILASQRCSSSCELVRRTRGGGVGGGQTAPRPRSWLSGPMFVVRVDARRKGWWYCNARVKTLLWLKTVILTLFSTVAFGTFERRLLTKIPVALAAEHDLLRPIFFALPETRGCRYYYCVSTASFFFLFLGLYGCSCLRPSSQSALSRRLCWVGIIPALGGNIRTVRVLIFDSSGRMTM